MSSRYDRREDVLYVNFGTDEISVTDEVCDDLFVDIGYYSGVVTGFRVIGPRAKGLTVEVIFQKLVPKVQRLVEQKAREQLRPFRTSSLSRQKSELRHVLSA